MADDNASDSGSYESVAENDQLDRLEQVEDALLGVLRDTQQYLDECSKGNTVEEADLKSASTSFLQKISSIRENLATVVTSRGVLLHHSKASYGARKDLEIATRQVNVLLEQMKAIGNDTSGTGGTGGSNGADINSGPGDAINR